MNPEPKKADQIANDLRWRIRDGRLPPNVRPSHALAPRDELPSVVQLMETYATSRQTVVNALAALAAGGLITRRPGKVYVVADPAPYFVIRGTAFDRSERQARRGRTSFEDQCAERGEHGSTVHHPPRYGLEAPADVAGHLQLDDMGSGHHSTLVAYLVGEGYSTPLDGRGEPIEQKRRCVGVYDAWLIDELADALSDWPSSEGFELYDLIDQAGATIMSRRIEIYGRESTATETTRLGLDRPVPVFVEEFAALDGNDRPLTFYRLVKPYTTVRWSFTLPVGD